MLAAPGPTLDGLAGVTGSSLGEIGVLFTANGLGFVVGAILAGRLFSRVPGNLLLAGSVAVMAIGASIVPTLGTLAGVVAVFTVIGFAIGAIDVGANTLIVWLFGDKAPPYLNTLHLCWAVGALVAPLLVARIAAASGDVLISYWWFAGVTAPVAIWLLTIPRPGIPVEASRDAGTGVLLRHRFLVVAMAILFFLHVGAELAFGGWIFSFAVVQGLVADTSARVLNSLFWGGIVIGRVAAVPLSLRLSPRTMIQIDLIGAAIGIMVLGLIPDWPPALWVGTVIFGVSLASIFASCINYVSEVMPITSQVTAAFLIGASVGSMVLPWLVGRLFDPLGPEAMVYVVGGAILAALGTFALIRGHVSRTLPPVATPV